MCPLTHGMSFQSKKVLKIIPFLTLNKMHI